MGKFRDLTRIKVGRLTVISRAPNLSNINSGTQWNCVCDCGQKRIVGSGNLLRGRAKSCGCLHKEIVAAKSTKHGRINTPEYKIWKGMKGRCYMPTNGSYVNYGARGISVCDRWRQSFESFLTDMGSRPSAKHSIERIDVNGNYEPSNCKWATRFEQENNKRTNVFVTWNGKTLTYSQWARELNENPATIRERYLRTGSFEKKPRTYFSYLKKEKRNGHTSN